MCICRILMQMSNLPIGSASPLPFTSLQTLPNFSRFKCQLNWPWLASLYRDVFTGVWRGFELFPLVSIYTYCFFINCSYVRVVFGHYDPEYTTHLNNCGHNNHNSMKKYHSFP